MEGLRRLHTNAFKRLKSRWGKCKGVLWKNWRRLHSSIYHIHLGMQLLVEEEGGYNRHNLTPVQYTHLPATVHFEEELMPYNHPLLFPPPRVSPVLSTGSKYCSLFVRSWNVQPSVFIYIDARLGITNCAFFHTDQDEGVVRALTYKETFLLHIPLIALLFVCCDT